MAMAMSHLSQRTAICISKTRPTFKHSSVTPNGPAMLSSHFITSKFQYINIKSGSKMMWSTNTCNIKQGFQQKRKERLRAVAEEDTQVEEQAVTPSVVSRSDMLTMVFLAEGFLDEELVPKVIKALEGIENVSDVSVETVETLTTIELLKETTIQATGVASGLVELLQRMDFRLINLNLYFEDEEEEEEEAMREKLFEELTNPDSRKGQYGIF